MNNMLDRSVAPSRRGLLKGLALGALIGAGLSSLRSVAAFAADAAGWPADAFKQKTQPDALKALAADPRSRRIRALVEQTTLLDDLDAEPPVTDEDLSALAAVPCVAIGGGHSPFVPSLARIRRVCPHVRTHLLPGGHDVHVGDAGGVTDLLSGFLDTADTAHTEAAHG